MASTNKTTNYELSQYIGSDKPTYLGDYNADMLKIDTALHQNAQNIESVGSQSQTANENANTALQNANTAQNTANQANSIALDAQNIGSNALDKATTNENEIKDLKGRIVYDNTLTEDSQTLVIPGLDIVKDKGYRIYFNGTVYDASKATGDLLTLNCKPTNVTALINRIMGLQITPFSPTVDKISNDAYTLGLILNRFTNGLGGSGESLLQFRPNSGTDNDNLLHCISTWGIANNNQGSCGQISSVFRGQGMTNVTSLTIQPTSGVIRAGTRIIISKI